jgi:outer membrane receptor protein involved in Fe transport
MTFPALRSALLASIALVPAPLMAQEVAAADQPASSTTIIVTSQKIEQRAQDVPITISAVTGDRIEELGVSDLDELSNYVPGLNIQEQSANNPGIVIRGITSDSGSSQQGPRVTLYYNGVDISRSRGSYQAIYDLERVEVIKGPQATLFGTASAVGAISLVSARPRAGFSGEMPARTCWPGVSPSNGASAMAMSKTSTPGRTKSSTRRTSSACAPRCGTRRAWT